MAPLYVNPDGSTVNVSGTEAIARYEASPVHSLAVAEVAPAFPEGEPAKAWTVTQLTAWAAEHAVDLGGATKKDDILAAIEAAQAAPAFDPSEHSPDEVFEYLTGLDDTNAEARDAEVRRVVEAERAGENRLDVHGAIGGSPA
jgi:hypothetical protein